MKKFTVPFTVLLLLVFLMSILAACGVQQQGETQVPETAAPETDAPEETKAPETDVPTQTPEATAPAGSDRAAWDSSYEVFLSKIRKDAKEDYYYALKDMDGDGTEELLLHTPAKMTLSIYTFTDRVVKVGSNDFWTGTLRLLHTADPDYPGIIWFDVGGGMDHYGYITVKDGQMTMEPLWDYNYSGIAPEGEESEESIEYSEDKRLIEVSKQAYENDTDIEFKSIFGMLEQFSELLMGFLSDDDNSEEYNTAIRIYDRFLNGAISAYTPDLQKKIHISDLETYMLEPGIDSFTLYDVDHDGIPELHTHGFYYDVFSVKENGLVCLFEGVIGSSSVYDLLKDGAILARRDTTGAEYWYTTFDENGEPTTVNFAEWFSRDETIYEFEGQTVSQEEYEEKTGAYFALAEKKADVQWYSCSD